MSPATARLRSKVSSSDTGSGTVVDATLKLDGVDLTNEASTIVTDKLTATARTARTPHGRRHCAAD